MTTLLDLLAKLRLDSSQYERGLSEAENQANGFGDKLKKGLGVAAKVGGAALAAVGTAAIAMGKEAIEAYANYEQLIGGVETLFGAGGRTLEEYAADMGKTVDEVRDKYESLQSSQNTILEKANNAWKTAGISANDYMEQAVSYSTAMIQALGGDTEKAAEMVDLAITDMSDNVNKLGTSMEAAQNAYRGLMRGNFMMIDNLQLGYQGTRAEMERLLDDAEKIKAANGEMVEYSIDNFADMVEAIHVIQENLGITGTTAKEATETIQGSLNAMKAAWKNLLVAMADDTQDFDKIMDNFVESAVTFGKNIIPRIQTVIRGLTKLITESASKLLPIVVETLIENLPLLIEAAVQLLTALAVGIIDAIPELVAAIPVVIEALIKALVEAWPKLKQAGLNLLQQICYGIDDGVWMIGTAIYDGISDALDKINDAIEREAEWEAKKYAEMLEVAKETVENIKKSVKEKVDEIVDWLKKNYEEAKKMLKDAVENRLKTVIEYFNSMLNKIREYADTVKERVEDFLQWLYDSTIGKFDETVEDLKKRVLTIKEKVVEFIENAREWGRDLINNFWEGATEKWNMLKTGLKAIAQDIKDYFGHSHPKLGPLADDYKWMPDMMDLFAKGIRDNAWKVRDQIEDSFDFGSSMFSPEIFGSSPVNNNTSTTYNYFTVNGIEQLNEIVDWFENRQVVARMG